eukprot:14983463-Alexandrium_andersonii.AAC.1
MDASSSPASAPSSPDTLLAGRSLTRLAAERAHLELHDFDRGRCPVGESTPAVPEPPSSGRHPNHQGCHGGAEGDASRVSSDRPGA